MNRQTEWVQIRLTREDKRTIVKAAKVAGMATAPFLVKLGLAEAEKQNRSATKEKNK